VAVITTSITNQKSHVTALTEDTEIKPGRVIFQISGFLNIYMDFFMDFTESI